MSSPAPSTSIDPAPAGEPAPAQTWSKVITPCRPTFSLPWGELWEYGDLVKSLAWRNITTYYAQTVLGPVWFLLQPLLVTAVFSYLFGRMARFGSDDIPHYLFYMGGLVPWGFFADSVSKTANVFVDNSEIFAKVYFPRLAIPISSLLTNLCLCTVQFGLFLCGLFFYLAKGNPFIHPNWWILLTPLVFVQLGGLALGLGCIVSALSRRFRDLALGVRMGLQLLMFGSAIVFPLTHFAPKDRWIFFLNPVVPPIEFFRFAFLGKSMVEPWHIALSSTVSLLVLVLGLVLFNRAEQNAMDTV